MIEQLQLNLKEEYRAVFDFEVALFQTVRIPSWHSRLTSVASAGIVMGSHGHL